MDLILVLWRHSEPEFSLNLKSLRIKQHLKHHHHQSDSFCNNRRLCYEDASLQSWSSEPAKKRFDRCLFVTQLKYLHYFSGLNSTELMDQILLPEQSHSDQVALTSISTSKEFIF